jgi:hypothetical protein
MDNKEKTKQISNITRRPLKTYYKSVQMLHGTNHQSFWMIMLKQSPWIPAQTKIIYQRMDSIYKKVTADFRNRSIRTMPKWRIF